MVNDKANTSSPNDLRNRSLRFSHDVIKFLKHVPNTVLTTPLKNQLVRSATSIGANFTEAKSSGSRKDFRNKVLIAGKEASETLYWLDLFDEFSNDEALAHLQAECRELLLILRKISVTVKA